MATGQHERVAHALDALAQRIEAQRRLGVEVPRCAVCFVVSHDAGSRQHTLVSDLSARCLEGPVILPGLPRVIVRISAADLLAVLSGERATAELIANNALVVEGRVEVIGALADCFPSAKSWLSARL